MPDVYCKKCGWSGNTSELNGLSCPKCGATKEIDDCYPDNEPLWEIMDAVSPNSFNWNKP